MYLFSKLNSVPGPGTYRLPSDFGYYEAKNGKNPVAQNNTTTEEKKEEKK
jgi:hypothetical protein